MCIRDSDYMRHFISAVERVLRMNFKLDEIQLGNRVVRIDALPMGINYDLYHNASTQSEVRQACLLYTSDTDKRPRESKCSVYDLRIFPERSH